KDAVGVHFAQILTVGLWCFPYRFLCSERQHSRYTATLRRPVHVVSEEVLVHNTLQATNRSRHSAAKITNRISSGRKVRNVRHDLILMNTSTFATISASGNKSPCIHPPLVRDC